ncbi:MAG TPA: gamma-glutamyl-gamma-aminobutyrate hydrolase family protein [Gemmataceae bacterium]|nr:gamma-glutamyl-gamma-aminobutyrate hydrolase family protein [Gemmataceae bacterium]
MSKTASLPRIGIYGRDHDAHAARVGCALWAPGYAGTVTAAGAEPVTLTRPRGRRGWEDVLAGLDGAILLGVCNQEDADFCEHCRERRLPLLAVDDGMQLLNTTYGGTLFTDLPRERPEALQHRHPPERGLRHAITVVPGTRLGRIYGDSEIVVNSEHRQAVDRVARGFQVSATALDGVIEGIELEGDEWFAIGVQWQPASATASGLDIQLFRALVEACVQTQKPSRRRKVHAAA